MSITEPGFHLSEKAFSELKEIFKKEYPDEVFTDEQMREAGMNLLRLFSIISTKNRGEESSSLGKTPAAELTEREQEALKFINEQILLKRQPSVRDVAQAVGLKSSRSGARMVDSLIAKGYLRRGTKEELVVD